MLATMLLCVSCCSTHINLGPTQDHVLSAFSEQYPESEYPGFFNEVYQGLSDWRIMEHEGSSAVLSACEQDPTSLWPGCAVPRTLTIHLPKVRDHELDIHELSHALAYEMGLAGMESLGTGDWHDEKGRPRPVNVFLRALELCKAAGDCK